MRRIPSALLFVLAALWFPGGADATVMGLVERVCTSEKLPYGRETGPLPMGDRSVELSPGHPEYDQFARLLPGPPPGWSADAPKVTAFASHTIGCGFSAGQQFRKDERTLVVALMFAPVSTWLRDELAKEKPDIRPPDRLFEHKGRKGFEMTHVGERSIMLPVGNLTLTIAGSADDDVKRGLLDRTNLEAVEAFQP